MVRRAAQSAYQRVLVPVDFSQNSRAALFTAMALAPNSAFELLHVVDFPFEGRMRMAGASDADLARYREQGLSQALEKLRELESEVRGRGHIAAAQLRSGDVRFELPRVVREQGIDLVAMGKQGQSALGDMFLGSACSWALEHAGCDVLVVPPGTLAAQP